MTVELEVVAGPESVSGQGKIAGRTEKNGITTFVIQTPHGKHDIFAPLVGRQITDLKDPAAPQTNLVPRGEVRIKVVEESE